MIWDGGLPHPEAGISRTNVPLRRSSEGFTNLSVYPHLARLLSQSDPRPMNDHQPLDSHSSGSPDSSEGHDVTVLMSVYNGKPYLNAAIESVVAQTYEDFTFLIVDDASTDGSQEILRRWSDQDDRIQLVLNEVNKGLGAVLADGMDRIRTPLTARMDADDIAHADRLERQIAFLDDNPEVDIVGTFATDINENGESIKLRRFPTTHDEILRLIWTCPILHPTVMMRTGPVRQVGGYDPHLRKRQDYELWFRCAEAGLRFANIPEPLLEYRFSNAYYQRNDLSVAWNQAKIGWNGCRLINAPPWAYVGVAVPFLRTLLPRPLNALVHRVLDTVDPRRSPASQTPETQ